MGETVQTAPLQTPGGTSTYTLFICHAEEDSTWVERYLLPHLGLDRQTCITAKQFRLGESKAAEFERAVTQSRYTLLVLSRYYLRDEWAEFGELLISQLAVESRRDRLIPLRLDDSEVPLRIRFRVDLDCTEEARWDGEIARLRELLGQPEPVLRKPPCPYLGLRPFREEDAAGFYGRSREVDSLADIVGVQSYLLLVGASGSGKSSLVFAGLVPRLEERQPGLWLVRSMRPKADPMEGLTGALDGASTPEQVETVLRKNARRRLLLVVDQFEEVFAVADEKRRNDFISALVALRQTRDCAVLLTMRADFYHSLLPTPLAPQDGQQVNVLPLRGAGLREAVVKPAANLGVVVERRLVEQLLADTADEPGILPILQETLRLLWERMPGRLLLLEAYNNLDPPAPGVTVALALHGREALAGLENDAQRRIARRILLRLVQFGEGRADTRRQQPLEALHSADDASRDFDATLTRLVEQRILMLDSEVHQDARPHVDLAHEILIARWPVLQEWIAKRKDAELTRRRLCAKAEEWMRLRARGGGLLDEAEVADAEQWTRSPEGIDLGIDPSVVALIETSRKALRRQRIHSRIISGGFVVLACALAGVIWVSLAQTMAYRAAWNVGFEWDDRAATVTALRAVSMARILRTPIEVLHQAVQAREQDGRLRFKGEVKSVAFSPDGNLLAGASEDGTVRVRDPESDAEPQVFQVSDTPNALFGVAFSPDSRQVAAGTADGKVAIWRLGEAVSRILDIGSDAVISVAWSSDGSLLAAGSQDGNVTIVSLRDQARKMLAPAHQGRVNQVAFSPDGRFVATASTDRTARLWELSSGSLKREFAGHQRAVTGVAFAPDGRRLLTSSADARLRLWDFESNQPRRVMSRGAPPAGLEQEWMNGNGFSSVAIAPDGSVAAGRTVLKYAEVWDVARGVPAWTLRGHAGGVTAVAFSSRGKPRLATASRDGTVRMYYLNLADLDLWARRLTR